MKLHELDDHRLVDTIRVILGLEPLHLRQEQQHCRPTHGHYFKFEALGRLAHADCPRCGGSGYFDGDTLDANCPCTGLAQRAAAPARIPVQPDPAFAYRGRRWPPKVTP